MTVNGAITALVSCGVPFIVTSLKLPTVGYDRRGRPNGGVEAGPDTGVDGEAGGAVVGCTGQRRPGPR